MKIVMSRFRYQCLVSSPDEYSQMKRSQVECLCDKQAPRTRTGVVVAVELEPRLFVSALASSLNLDSAPTTLLIVRLCQFEILQ